jgi:hypothetical protein
MNPTLRQTDIDREMDRDPASGLAEYYAEFRTDISAFVSQEIVDGCVASGVFALPPATGHRPPTLRISDSSIRQAGPATR